MGIFGKHTHVSPAPRPDGGRPTRSEGSEGHKHKDYSYFSWLLAQLPTLVVLVMIACSFLEGTNERMLVDAIPLLKTMQFNVFFWSCVPLLEVSYLASSLLAGLGHDDISEWVDGEAPCPHRLSWPPSQVFLMIMTEVLVILSGLFVLGPYTAGPAGQMNKVYNLIALTIAVMLVAIVFRRLRINFVRREFIQHGKDGPAQYLHKLVPALAGLAAFSFGTFVIVNVHACSMPLIPRPTDVSLIQELCSHELNQTYFDVHCTRERATLSSHAVIHGLAEASFGLGTSTLVCTDHHGPPAIGGYRSLLDSCNAIRLGKEISQLSYLPVGITLAGLTLIYIETLKVIDDELNSWNWLDRVLHWDAIQTANGQTIRKKSYSTTRLTLSIIFAGLGLSCAITLSLSTLVSSYMRSIYLYDVMFFAGQIAGGVNWIVAFTLLALQFRHRRIYRGEVSAAQRVALERIKADIAAEKDKDVCSFWFVRASFILDYSGPFPSLPRFQVLKEMGGDPLHRVAVSTSDAYNQMKLSEEYLIVSQYSCIWPRTL